jgi:hypothetical protein
MKQEYITPIEVVADYDENLLKIWKMKTHYRGRNQQVTKSCCYGYG